VISPTSSPRAPLFAVVVHEKGGAERRETFESAELTVGRVQGNELMLPKGNVSKRHARLLYRDGRFIVTDLNSTNGTYVNRRRITQATIVREGDRIYVGDFVLRIELPESEPGALPPRGELGSNAEEISVTGASANPTLQPQEPGEADDPGRLTRATEAVPAVTPSEVGSEPPQRGVFPLNETTGTHHVGRTTHDDAPSYERGALRALVDQVVQSVVDKVGSEAFDEPVDAALTTRVDQLLQELSPRLGPAHEAPLGTAPERMLQLARDELLECGVLSALLADAAVSEIAVLRYDEVVAVRGGRSAGVEPGFSSERALRWAVQRLIAQSGHPEPAEELRLPWGARVSIDPARHGKGLSLLVRKGNPSVLSLDELVRRGVISRAIATFLRHCLTARVNLLVIGGRDGSADLLLNALSSSAGDSRFLWVGEGITHRSEPIIDFALGSLEQARRSLAIASAVPGLRIVARLTRPEILASVTDAIAAGADGVLGLRYATSLRRGLARITADMVAARSGLDVAAARELVSGAYDVIVEVARLSDDRVRVLRVAEVLGVVQEELQVQDIFTFFPDRTAAGGAVEGTFAASGAVPQVVEWMRARGENLDSAIFSRPSSR
jgi:pilus assembly protein CpaF